MVPWLKIPRNANEEDLFPSSDPVPTQADSNVARCISLKAEQSCLASLGSKDQSELPTMLLASPRASTISQGLGPLTRALGDGLARKTPASGEQALRSIQSSCSVQRPELQAPRARPLLLLPLPDSNA